MNTKEYELQEIWQTLMSEGYENSTLPRFDLVAAGKTEQRITEAEIKALFPNMGNKIKRVGFKVMISTY